MENLPQIPEELKSLVDFMDKHNFNIEDLIREVVKLVEWDKNNQKHELVVACLEGCIENLNCAAFNYYASTK